MTLYLKYRPKDFDDLVGQDFIKNTLKQAVIKGRLVGAYLFCGPRGTGKTSTARIFAKAINCLNLKDGNPCGKCEICRAISDGSLVDVIEIDAASYTGVDNIRDIIEKANFSPTRSKYKVYIIDEVHMLSKGAFNALLKILEEPPMHLKFILATTESHKIPETILSRCQRYDFRGITPDDLKKRLLHIAKLENIKIDDESLEFIIKESNGGLRNAISLFEQLIQDSEINFESIIKNYGIAKKEILSKFYEKILGKDNTLLSDYEYISKNYNLNLFFRQLLFYIRDKLVDNIQDKNLVSRNIFILETLEEAYLKARNSFDPKTTFLVGLVKCIFNVKEENRETENTRLKVKKEDRALEVEEVQTKDLLDIFGDEDFEKDDEITQSKKNLSETFNFEMEKFVEELKNLQAKGALIASIKGSSLNFDGKKLTIHTKTKISLKQISNPDNISLVIDALKRLGFFDISIEIK